jgi:hypothetical protein
MNRLAKGEQNINIFVIQLILLILSIVFLRMLRGRKYF